jgi:tRNA dimethylallyltransferase
VEREDLFERISKRVDKMMDDGLLGEVHSLLPCRDLNALKTVGYQELFRYFDGELELDEAIEKIKTNTRRYAKRQLTWFKRDEEMEWFSPGEITDAMAYLYTRMGEYQDE